MPSWTESICLFLLLLSPRAKEVYAEDAINRSPYSIVLDGGSTGSRLHIFEFVLVNTTTGQTDCVRRGSARSYKPLSAFARPREERNKPLNATYVADHLMHLFQYAADVIPEEFYMSTFVTYQATAGMRLLDDEEQDAVYDALFDGLMESDNFVFRGTKRRDLSTLSGDMEAFYGVVAANYLKGVVDSKLRTIDDNAKEETKKEKAYDGPLGAMDMGGSSTQIVYMPGSGDAPQRPAEENDDGDSSYPARISENDFFAASHLSYGVDRFRERLWDTWVEERKSDCEERNVVECTAEPIMNPCAFKGYEIKRMGFKLVGTGDADECVKQVRRLIPHSTPDAMLSTRRVAGVEHPPLRGRFVAMSLYFFSLDSLRVLSEPSKEAHEALNEAWPNPSIEELHDALHGMCSRSWHDDLVHIQHNSHTYTRAEVLPHRCFECVYMATLLRDGYGFHPSSRDITFTFLVDGSEVEWSLGLALSRHAEEYEATLAKLTSAESNITFEEDCEPEDPTIT